MSNQLKEIKRKRVVRIQRGGSGWLHVHLERHLYFFTFANWRWIWKWKRDVPNSTTKGSPNKYYQSRILCAFESGGWVSVNQHHTSTQFLFHLQQALVEISSIFLLWKEYSILLFKWNYKKNCFAKWILPSSNIQPRNEDMYHVNAHCS